MGAGARLLAGRLTVVSLEASVAMFDMANGYEWIICETGAATETLRDEAFEKIRQKACKTFVNSKQVARRRAICSA